MPVPVIRESLFLKRDSFFQVQRVVTSGGERFLLKLGASDPPGVEEALLENEFRILRQVQSEHVLAPVRIDTRHERVAAYYEDLDGRSLLSEVDGPPIGLADFALVVRDLCAALRVFHDHGFVLGGLSPRSFMRDGEAGRIVLVDAPLAQEAASYRPQEELWLGGPYLPYAAPELIGQVPVEVDARADLYALGAVLYELLGRRPPFDARDAAELVQCHLAKHPRPLAELHPSLPEGIAEIVMRLLAKDPLERFDSVMQFERELARETDVVPHSGARWSGGVRLGRGRSPRFSTKLYGLEGARRVLQEKTTQARSAPLMVFLEGEAGVGKTSLLLETRAALRHGYFCAGRFAPAGPVAPLSGWASILCDLANVVLTRSPAEAEAWRRKVSEALGEGASLVGVLVPEWARILNTSAVETSDGEVGASVNRLAVAIHGLLGCFAGPDAPLVLALDDLQWADGSSLRILELVLALRGPLNLVVLGAHRPASSSEGGPSVVENLVESLGRFQVEVERLRLREWGEREVSEFLVDSFTGTLTDAPALTALVMARTHGNPFFVHEFVRVLVEQGSLALDQAAERWSWQADRARSLPPAETVVAFLERKILGLRPDLKQALRAAACLGTSFQTTDFAVATDVAPEQARGLLALGVEEGLLLSRPSSDSAGQPGDLVHEFIHDRVFEACRTLATDAERATLCLAMGRRYRAAPDIEQRDASVHLLAGFMNTARTLVTSETELVENAELNLRAGRLAKARSAFSQALEYFRCGLQFLHQLDTTSTTSSWTAEEPLTRSLHEEAAETALLTGQLPLMHELCDAILARAPTPLQKLRTYEIRIRGFNSDKRYPEAVAAACEVLQDLGVTFPSRLTTVHTILGYLRIRRKILSGPIQRLADLPVKHDPVVKAASRMMQAMYSSAYLGRPTLFPLLVYRHISDSLEHGNDEYSCVTYHAFAIVLCEMGDFAHALELGEVGLKLLGRLHADKLKANVFMGQYAFMSPWKVHLRDTIPYHVEAAQAALAHGDFEFTCHMLTFHALARFHSGLPLAELAVEFEQQGATIASLKQERSIILQQLLCQMVRDLKALPLDGAPLSGPFYDEDEKLPRCLEPLDQNLAFHHYMVKAMLGLFLGDGRGALAAAKQGREHYEGGAFGIYLGAIFTGYEALIWLGAARTDRTLRREGLKRALAGERRLARWADAAPMNFRHRYELVRAERSRVLGHFEQAAKHFETAIELSQAHGYLHDTALAEELAAEFYLERGMERVGRYHLRECHVSYRRWGAAAVTQRLEQRYPQHFSMLVATGGGRESASLLPKFSDSLNYRVLLRSSQAISSEVALPRLLERLLSAMFEHAGAQRAVLILERGDRLFLEAEADVDRTGLHFFENEPVDGSQRVCRSVVNYVARMGKSLVLGDAATDGRFTPDPYVVERSPKSVLCIPIQYQGTLLGLAYLENNRVSHVFTEGRLEVANLLAGQAAISIANTRTHALELKAEQAKINPHFLFNALTSIAELAIIDGVRAEAAIVKLSHLYRYILETSTQQLVSLEQELAVVRSYLALEKLGIGPRLEYVVTCEGKLDGVKMPGLLVQPLVENCIRHAISPRVRGGKIWVLASEIGDRCRIIVQDDGDGLASQSSGTGFGLRSVQDRLSLVYGQSYSMAISRRGGYRVEIEIPLSAPS
jgi:predicted ATPase/GAF domain-containing protein